MNYNTGYDNDRQHPLVVALLQDFETALRVEKDSLCYAIYKDLEEEYSDRCSDEQVKETIEANEYEFTEEGALD